MGVNFWVAATGVSRRFIVTSKLQTFNPCFHGTPTIWVPRESLWKVGLNFGWGLQIPSPWEPELSKKLLILSGGRTARSVSLRWTRWWTSWRRRVGCTTWRDTWRPASSPEVTSGSPGKLGQQSLRSTSSTQTGTSTTSHGTGYPARLSSIRYLQVYVSRLILSPHPFLNLKYFFSFLVLQVLQPNRLFQKDWPSRSLHPETRSRAGQDARQIHLRALAGAQSHPRGVQMHHRYRHYCNAIFLHFNF